MSCGCLTRNLRNAISFRREHTTHAVTDTFYGFTNAHRQLWSVFPFPAYYRPDCICQFMLMMGAEVLRGRCLISVHERRVAQSRVYSRGSVVDVSGSRDPLVSEDATTKTKDHARWLSFVSYVHRHLRNHDTLLPI
jgi:hypothetical protein